jgi:hypothetical protein
MLASQAKTNFDRAIAERNDALDQKKKAENRLQNVSVTASTLSIGEYDTQKTLAFPPRKYCYTDPNAHAKEVCGADEPRVKAVYSEGGNKCGYSFYVITCLKR